MRATLGTLVEIVDRLSGALAVLGAALLGGIALAVFYEVVARFVFAAPTEWSLELTTYALVWSSFFGAAEALRRGRHVKVDLLLERLSPAAQRGIGFCTDLVAFVFCVLVVREGARFVYQSYVTDATSISTLRMPMFIPELAVPLGAALLALQFLTRLLGRAGMVGDGP